MTSFIIKQDHLTLLKRTCWGWDSCEFGAPAIDCKRPYGNYSVLEDMAEILPGKTEDELMTLHEELMSVLQIICVTQSFELGEYQKQDDYGFDWKKV